jgi:hypothetical protein
VIIFVVAVVALYATAVLTPYPCTVNINDLAKSFLFTDNWKFIVAATFCDRT